MSNKYLEKVAELEFRKEASAFGAVSRLASKVPRKPGAEYRSYMRARSKPVPGSFFNKGQVDDFKMKATQNKSFFDKGQADAFKL